jgi:H+/Cl- antiporter ClcA
MPCVQHPGTVRRHRMTRFLIATLAFTLGAGVVIVLAVRMYLLPAYEAWRSADPQQRDLISASSALLLALVLVVLLLLLVAAFGIRRFFFPQPPSQRTQTRYIDAWAEAGRRK